MVLKQTGNSVSKLQAKILIIIVLILQVVHIERIRVMKFYIGKPKGEVLLARSTMP